MHGVAGAQFLGACLTPGCTMLITELLNGGSLQDKLRNGLFTWYKGCVSMPAHYCLVLKVYASSLSAKCLRSDRRSLEPLCASSRIICKSYVPRWLRVC